MKPKILVIDDVANVRQALRAQLSSLNCDVLDGGTVEEARRLLEEHWHELSAVILDLRLVATEEKEGHESGLVLLNDVKNDSMFVQTCFNCFQLRFIPSVIVFTSWPSVRSCREAFLRGAIDYLDKTADGVWELLIERVKQALDRSAGMYLQEARKWVETHYDELLSKYGGQTLALDGNRVVDSANTVDELKAKLETKRHRANDFLLVTITKE